MALAVDAVSSDSGSGAGPFTMSHTTSGSNRVMVVGIAYYHPSAVITACTYNSVSLTAIPSAAADMGDYHVRVYGLIAPDTGSNTVSFSASLAMYGFGIGVMTYTGAHQTAPFGIPASATGNDTDPTVDVLAAADELAMDTLCILHSGTLSAGSGQTSRWNAIQSTGFIKYAGSTEPGAGAITMSWANTSSQPWALVAVPVKPVAAGGGSAVPVYMNHRQNQGMT